MSAINEERVKNKLDEMLRTIQTEADPQALNQYRALIRKKVSFFQRSYLGAYLLMLQDQESGGRSRGKPNTGRDNSAPRGDSRPSQPTTLPVALPDDESVRLFISVGRNRRVFPREILGLICTKTAIPKDDIGLINILNNYSFVQVRTSAAEEIIAALNGINFRGRTLAVNYAKARKEDDDTDTGSPLEDGSEESDTSL
ncbi:hypothetical protein AGMMS49940_21930 [Spirochaetia bacterium]|nr:hypothetical protein AGMMS49940_21930 [Spirochaetia bacterium]